MMNRYQFRHWINAKLDGKLIEYFARVKRYQTDVISGNKITYEPNTDIGGKLFFYGQFEENELSLCKQYIKEDSIVLDIGANIGLHSLSFAELAPSGCVVAFEPSLATFELLVKNVNGKSNISPVNLAITDTGGILDFFQASDNAYSSLVDTKRKGIVKVSKVPCMKTDDVVDALQLRRVDFIKIDVEGLEHNVLKGMEKVIAKYHPVIFCEIYQGKASNPEPDVTVRYLLDREYSAYVMRDGKIVEYQKHEDRFYNYLFLPAGGVHP
jgi:FkbM family methyltransferase